ncbi:MAG TPA: zf-HC2 domain-containing protein [Acidimicrobiia bacterium]
MSILTCAEVRDLASEHALGVLGGAERAEVIAHCNECARCRAFVNELTEVADVLPTLVPEAEPPAGFERRVLTRLTVGRRRARRRWVASVAAVAAAAAIVSITVVRIAESNDATRVVAPTSTAVVSPVAVAMRGGPGDAAAGWVYVTGGRSVAVAVDYGVPSGSYRLEVRTRNGSARELGTMAITNGHGSWTGASPRPITSGNTIALVDAAGNDACRGTVTGSE